MLPPLASFRKQPLKIESIGERRTYFDYRRKCLHAACVIYQSCECTCNNNRCYEGLFITLKPHKKITKRNPIFSNEKNGKSHFKKFIKYRF